MLKHENYGDIVDDKLAHFIFVTTKQVPNKRRTASEKLVGPYGPTTDLHSGSTVNKYRVITGGIIIVEIELKIGV